MSLTSKLRAFKLAGMARSLDTRITYANNNSLSYSQFLELLCEDEENSRRDSSYKKRYSKAKLPAHKTLQEFDFNFQPSINKKQISDLATCQYIDDKKNVIFIGNPGTGKSHLSIALGLNAITQNRNVLFTSVSDMLYQLHISKADNSYHKKLNEYTSFDLLILDELGFKKLPSYSIDDFFDVISRRYEQGSCIITTNKEFDQWGEILGDKVLSGAILDRIVHCSTVIKINGPSFRARSIKSSKKEAEDSSTAESLN